MKFIIAGGGTGGHVFPAIATADAIKEQQPQAEILFVGSKNYMEMELVPKAGYEIVGMNIYRMNRTGWWKNYKQPFQVLIALFQSYKLINKFKPDAVIGTGSFACFPIVKMAQLKGIPTFIQEQNAYPGIAVRLLAGKTKRIHTAFKEIDGFIGSEKTMLTGNPVRQDIVKQLPDKKVSLNKLGLSQNKPTLAIIGGSRGAEPINKAIVKMMPELEKLNIQVYLQTGKKLYEPYKNLESKNLKITPFIDDIPTVLAAADVIITRAGAITISELALVGKTSILIPDTYSEQGHQDNNAQALADEKACIYIQEKDMDKKLLNAITKLFIDKDYSQKLGKNLTKFAFPNAARDIAGDVLNFLTKNQE